MNIRIRKLKALFYFILMVASLSFSAPAQDKNWRPISYNELHSNTPQVEADSSAEAIFWEEKIEQTAKTLTNEVYVRLKIFDERGASIYSTISAEYYSYYELSDFRVRITQSDGSSAELRQEDIVSVDLIKTADSKLLRKSFIIPNVRPGSIIEYKYHLSAGIKLDEWRLIFQKIFLCDKSSISSKAKLHGTH